MTLEEKIGQMFYVRCPVDDETALEYLTKYHLGGYILFYENVKEKSKEELSSEIQSYQNGAEYPLLIGVDEEGGTVNRVSLNPELRETEFLSPKDIFAKDGWDGITADAEEKADLLLSLGINVNMAPVCDLSSDANAFMYERSFSSDFEETSQFVRYEVIVSKSKKLGTVLKHFPGYGNNGDTHEGIVYDNREYSEFEQNDFKPFIAGADAGADCILVSHNIVSCMDSEMPASLSENVHKIIRDELGFDGVIMTDDLIMSAITKFTDGQAAAVAAAKCGNDILCCSDIETQYPAVLEAVQNGEISEEQINQSVKRILIWKHNLGLI
jgi:beta-N-acetylhexosaminidase